MQSRGEGGSNARLMSGNNIDYYINHLEMNETFQSY